MNEQQSQMKEKQIAADQTYSSLDGLETPASTGDDGAFGGTETGGRTMVEVEDFYTAEKMHEHAEEIASRGNDATKSKRNVFNPVLDSVSEVSD